jgi:hypothetical protein
MNRKKPQQMTADIARQIAGMLDGLTTEKKFSFPIYCAVSDGNASRRGALPDGRQRTAQFVAEHLGRDGSSSPQ